MESTMPPKATLSPEVHVQSTNSLHQLSQPQRKPNFALQLMRKSFLDPKRSLWWQLMISFGSIIAFAITFVVVICIVFAQRAGRDVKQINQHSLEKLFAGIQTTSARYLAESLAIRLIPDDVVNILHETTRDRFAGYPDPSDAKVPFFDIESKTNKYPVRGQPLPLDWQSKAETLVTTQNYNEHLQDRWILFAGQRINANAYYFIRGECDPYETNSSARSFWPNCTDENNDITTGGRDAPSLTSEMIHRKVSDLGPLLKALYEYHQDIANFGIYFANSGAGSFIGYPQYLPDSKASYFSGGCDWMDNPNPSDPTRPIGSQEEINRCRPNGTAVAPRAYNVLERGWCRDQALQPNRIHVDGPYLDAWIANLLLITVGRSVYDRVTKSFIGCIGVDMVLSTVQKAVNLSAITSYMEVSVVRWDSTGTLVATSLGDGIVSAGDKILTIESIDVGVPRQRYDEVLSLIDYNKIWDPVAVNERYESYKINGDQFQVSSYPIPPVPESYNVNYQPDFLVFLSVYRNAIDDRVQNVNNVVDTHERQALLIAVVLGCAGMVLVLLIVAATSNMITFPLGNMNRAATQIMSSFGHSLTDNNNVEVRTRSRTFLSSCIPNTELNQLMDEFEKIVTAFSGSSLATSRSMKQFDTLNHFTLRPSFQGLYNSRSEEELGYIEKSADSQNTASFIHLGSNVATGDLAITKCEESSTLYTDELNRTLGSPLFVWITILIVTPLLITTVCISAIFLFKISSELRISMNFASKYYVDVELSALSYSAMARAGLASSTTSTSIRDLHLLTRYTSWLLFGGLARTESFTDVISGQEQCKTTTNLTECQFYHDYNVCDCAWHDTRHGVEVCTDYAVDSRYLQKTVYGCQSFDTWPNGDRNSTSFPNNSYSPQTTEWWYDVKSIPGSLNRSQAGGFETTYDRLRATSAIPLFQALYNYQQTKRTLTLYVTFERDGLFVGYLGCGIDAWLAPNFVSTDLNGAASLRPELCPIGRYGYDPRCRGWYDKGKRIATTTVGAIHVTPPYLFSGGTTFAQAATAPFYDPVTNTHLGQVLIDFSIEALYVSLRNRTVLARGGFPVLITAQQNSNGADTVIGPGFAGNESARPITELILPYDHNCMADQCTNHILRFENIHTAMRQGMVNSSSFQRSTVDGTVETVYIAYAPVQATSYRPLNSSDYSRGVLPSQNLVYSLALVETEQGLLQPFVKVQQEIEQQVQLAVLILAVSIIIAILFVVFISNILTTSFTEPMISLLKVMQGINRMDADHDPPNVDRTRGSKELTLLADTIETLYKLVRSVDAAYMAGDLEKTYLILDDALTLFRRLGNNTAAGVACNNLGNIMLAFYRIMKRTNMNNIGNLNRQAIIRKGVTYFTASIQLGEKTSEQLHERCDGGCNPICLEFRQHLSNRYFNRGMFLLSVSEEHDKPKDELEKMGQCDIHISRDMDIQIDLQGQRVGWGLTVNRLTMLFEIGLVRTQGHMMLQDLGIQDDWDIGAVLKNTFLLLTREIQKGSSTLFRNIGPIGRLQQLETVLMRYHVHSGRLLAASRIAIRCLIEDEYILSETHREALQVLLSFVKSLEPQPDVPNVLILQQQMEDYFNWYMVIDAKKKKQQMTSGWRNFHDAIDQDDEPVPIGWAGITISPIPSKLLRYNHDNKTPHTSIGSTASQQSEWIVADLTMEGF